MTRAPRLLRASGLIAGAIALHLIWPAPAGVIAQGLIVGALTALVAFGLSLTYGANRIVNFAQADMGVVPALLMVTLVGAHGWPYLAAVPLALALAVLTGLLVERLIIRPFADAPRLILSVATIGLAQILAGLGTAVPFLFGDTGLGQTLAPPFDFDFDFESVVFHGTDLMVVIAVPLTIAGLMAFLTRSPWGMAIRGVSESRDRASLLGINVAATQVIVWVATSVLAAIAMILRAGVYGLPIGSAFGPSILLRALAAAVIGRMQSYRRMYLAASAFGVVEASIIWNENSAILIDPAIFVILLGFLLVQRADRESRVADQAVSSWRSAALVREVPRELLRIREVRIVKRLVLGLVAAAAVLAPAVLSDAKVSLASALFVFCIIAVSLVVLTGWSGEISLGQMAFVAIGAATAAVINVEYRWDMSITMLLSGIVGSIAAVIIGLPALRIRGLFLAVTTLAFALATSSYLLNRRYFPILPDNTSERVRRIPLFGRTDVASEQAFYFVSLGALVLVLLCVAGLQRSRMRRVLLAARDNERNAQAFGVNLTRVRLSAFAISGFIAAFGGGLFTFQQQALGQQVFEPAQSLRVLTMAVIGGLGSVPGALLGAVFLKSTEWFNGVVGPEYRFLFSFAGSGVGLLLVLRFLPGGLSRPLYVVRDRWLASVARRNGLELEGFTGPASGAPRPSVDPEPKGRARAVTRRRRARRPILEAGSGGARVEVRSVDVHYGPIQILFGVDLEVEAGEIVALLGTNGAGKSTLLRAISGLTPPTAGSILIDGIDVAGAPPHQTARAGIVQVPGGKGIFPSLTVLENLTLATWPIRHQPSESARQIAEVLEMFPALVDRQHSAAATLSGGQQQMLTLGMAFLARPRLLMIDELSLGLAPVIVEQLLGVLRQINARGTTILLVEQSVNVALTVADRAYFLEKGEIRFSGPTAELLDRPDVLRSVYLHGAGGTSKARPRRARAAVPTVAPVLELRGLHKAFSGRAVIHDVDLVLHRGEILGIIGPNGAGKTTLFDLISGFLAPDAGQILLHGTPVQLLGPDVRSGLGLARSFQDARLFPDLTVLDTIKVALDHSLRVKDPLAAALGLSDVIEAERDLDRIANELVERFGVAGFRDKFVAELSTGSRRFVDIACQRALGSPILLFDEPSSGIAQREAEALGPVLLSLRDDLDASILVIEHDMPLLTTVSDRLVALDLGAVVCDGDADTVLSHPTVVASYLGSSRAAIERSTTA